MIKVCGITNPLDALTAERIGYTAIGLIFFRHSSRSVSVKTALQIRKAVPNMNIVGVFVDERPQVVQTLASFCKLDMIQLHGDENPADYLRCNKPVIKAVNNACFAHEAQFTLLDSNLGKAKATETDARNDHLAQAHNFSNRSLILSGGLDSQNVATLIRKYRPIGVDVARGVESAPGRKCPQKLYHFFQAAHRAFQQSEAPRVAL